MDIEYRYTKHHFARGTRADAERQDAFFLLKNVSFLRLTYQIRLLASRALQSGRKLVIRVPSSADCTGYNFDFFIRIEAFGEGRWIHANHNDTDNPNDAMWVLRKTDEAFKRLIDGYLKDKKATNVFYCAECEAAHP